MPTSSEALIFAIDIPQAFDFCLVAILNSPFEQKVGALDLLDEVVSLRHCH